MRRNYVAQYMQDVVRTLFGEPARLKSTYARGNLWGFSFSKSQS
jgi:hypothetical protein